MEVIINGQRWTLDDDKKLGAGGEGAVYMVPGTAYCVKIYNPEKRTLKLKEKIEYMIHHPPQRTEGEGFMLAWPLALVTDGSGGFLGFMMRRAFPGAKELGQLITPTMKEKRFGNDWPEWQRRFDRENGASAVVTRLKLMNNIVIPVHLLHQTNKYVLRDFKPNNVLVTYDGKVVMVDMDSIQISENGKLLHPGAVATPDYAPQELYTTTGIGTNLPLAPSWDNFSMAVVFYQLLIGAHPYAVTPKQDAAENTIAENIKNGLFAYGNKNTLIKPFQKNHSQLLYPRLPNNIRNLFYRAFDGTAQQRPTAEEWGRCIHQQVVNAGTIAIPVPTTIAKPVSSTTAKPAHPKRVPSTATTTQSASAPASVAKTAKKEEAYSKKGAPEDEIRRNWANCIELAGGAKFWILLVGAIVFLNKFFEESFSGLEIFFMVVVFVAFSCGALVLYDSFKDEEFEDQKESYFVWFLSAFFPGMYTLAIEGLLSVAGDLFKNATWWKENVPYFLYTFESPMMRLGVFLGIVNCIYDWIAGLLLWPIYRSAQNAFRILRDEKKGKR